MGSNLTHFTQIGLHLRRTNDKSLGLLSTLADILCVQQAETGTGAVLDGKLQPGQPTETEPIVEAVGQTGSHCPGGGRSRGGSALDCFYG